MTTPAEPITHSSQHNFPPLLNDLLLRTAQNQPNPHPPIWIMRQAGRYLPQYHLEKGTNDFFTCCRTPSIASNLTLQPIDEYPTYLDAAIIFSDILVVPQALGMDVIMDPGKGPVFTAPIKEPRDPQFEEILGKQVDVERELGYVFEAITMTRHKLRGRVPLFGFSGAPWTLLCYMVEGGGSKLFKDIKTFIYAYPAETHRLLSKITDVCIEYLALQVRAGAQILQVFDSWAGELAPSAFREFGLPYLREISKGIKRRLRDMGEEVVPLVVFAKGAWYALEDLCESDYEVVGLDWLHEPRVAMEVARRTGVVLQGNLDPGVLYGNEEAIEKAVEDMVEGFGGADSKGGWIVNLGHGVTPFIDMEKLRFFFKCVRRFTGAEEHCDGARQVNGDAKAEL